MEQSEELGMEHFEEVEWTFDNFCCWNEQVHGECIESPCVLCLYPKGKGGQEECMEVSFISQVPPRPGELSFLCSDGSIIHSQQVENPDKRTTIRVRGPRFEEVLALIEEKEGDTLTLRYRCKNYMENKPKFHTVIDVIDYTLEIDPVALGCGECGQTISYFAFVNKGNMSLTSNQNGNVKQLQLESSFSKDVILVKTYVSFLKMEGVLENYEEKEHVFPGEEEWVFFSINDRELAERGGTVLLRMRIITGNVQSILCTKGVSIIRNKCVCGPEKKPSESPIVPSDDSVTVLTKDFMCLFQDQDLSDLELKCGGVTVPVHRAVLSARSPVFKRLLCSDMREAASGSVDIEDLDAPTLARFLAFLYTGAVGEDLHADSALNLYYAADKYEVSSLKKECAEFLCANISLTNVCEILSLGDKHGDDELTKVSRSFILENYHEVLASENWKSFMKKEPLLAVETVTHFAGNVHVKKQSSK